MAALQPGEPTSLAAIDPWERSERACSSKAAAFRRDGCSLTNCRLTSISRSARPSPPNTTSGPQRRAYEPPAASFNQCSSTARYFGSTSTNWTPAPIFGCE